MGAAFLKICKYEICTSEIYKSDRTKDEKMERRK
jgi:hypothetical protein